MKKIIHIYIILSLTLIGHLNAQTFEVDGINYNILNSNEVEVTSKTPVYTGDIIIPTTVTFNSINYEVKAIGFEAFRDCFNVTSISLPNSIATIREGAFRNCRNITSLVIPDSVTLIEKSAFLYCTELISISLPSQITVLNQFVFASCINLVSIDIPEMVETIVAYAFTNCVSLTTVNIPSTVTSIAPRAFDNCTGLTTFNMDIVIPLSINPSVFDNVTLSNVNLNVPIGSEGAYSSAAVWQDFGNINGILNVDTIEQSQIKIYPNPATDYIRISNLDIENNYIIYDALGKIVRSGKMVTENNISIRALEKGIYFLKLNNYETLRFIKQ